APNLSAHTRAAISAAALALAKSVGYYSVGTLEFLVDRDENFYFLEMNTRLQVEHTVTEMVSGLDLVEWMVRVARGESIANIPPWAPQGWAIQARLCAEDPAQQYRPSVGRLQLIRQPAGPGIRFDHWLQATTEVTSFYDPLLGKVCAHGATREQARARLRVALDELVITGVTTNLDQLRAALDSPAFSSGTYTTGLLDALVGPPRANATRVDAAAASAAHFVGQERLQRSLDTQPASSNPWLQAYRPRDRKSGV